MKRNLTITQRAIDQKLKLVPLRTAELELDPLKTVDYSENINNRDSPEQKSTLPTFRGEKL